VKKGFRRILRKIASAGILAIEIYAIVVMTTAIINDITNTKVLRDDTITVELNPSSYRDGLFYENEFVFIIVGCDQYLVYLDNLIINFSEKGYETEQYIKQKNDLQVSGSCENKGISLNKYDVADLLESGSAFVFDKRKQIVVHKIKIRYYDYICGPLCGSGTRTYYLPFGAIFLEVQDWVS
jgi:hypothetical protein